MEKTKVIAIIQAHMSSSRLPGKILKDLCGMPALYRMIERVRHCKNIDEIVVATSTMECDDVLIELCNEWSVSTYRGSNDDVLERYWGAAQAYPAGTYMRLTSDCPLEDPGVLDAGVQYFWDHDFRYVNCEGKLPSGMGCYEVFTAELLKETVENSTEGYEHEHVTPYMYWKQDSIGTTPTVPERPRYRVTLDTPEDYAVIQNIYDALYQPGNHFNVDDVVAYLDAHPEVVAINSEIKQKGVKEGYEE